MKSTGQGGHNRRGGQNERRDAGVARDRRAARDGRDTYNARDTRNKRDAYDTRDGRETRDDRGSRAPRAAYGGYGRDIRRRADSPHHDNGVGGGNGPRHDNGVGGNSRGRGVNNGRGAGPYDAREERGMGRHNTSGIRSADPHNTGGIRDGYGYGGGQEGGRDGGRESAYDVEILAGRNSVYEALKAERPLNKILLQRGEPDGAGRAREGTLLVIEAIARDRGIVVQSVDRAKLEGLVGGSHQGVVAYASVKAYCLPDDILAYAAERAEAPLVIVACEIEDPHNLGSIIRSAEAAGAHGVVIPKRRAAGLTPAVSKASSGAIEYMRVARVANIAETLRSLKKQGLWIVGADASGARLYTDCDYSVPTALVIGGEGTGLGRLVRETCDYVAKLPMLGKVTSLNASVAASVFLYEAVRQRAIPK